MLPQWTSAIARDCATLACHSAPGGHAAAPAYVLADLARGGADASWEVSCVAVGVLRLVAARGPPYNASVQALLNEQLSAAASRVLTAEGPAALDEAVRSTSAAASALARVVGPEVLDRRFAHDHCVCDPCECVALAASVAAVPRLGALGRDDTVSTAASLARWALQGAAAAAEAPVQLLRAQCTAALLLLCALLGCFGDACVGSAQQRGREALDAAVAVLRSGAQPPQKHLALLIVAKVCAVLTQTAPEC